MVSTESAAGGPTNVIRDRLLEAIMPHVVFDGWSDASFEAACQDAGVAPGDAKAAVPRGAIDLALAFHAAGDKAMVERMEKADLASMRFRDRVAAAIRFRLDAVPDKELVRRGTTLFSLPQNAADGARAIWGTADAIWTTLGDSSQDVNWYSKRASLSAVYGATVLFWLGDTSHDNQATWAFLDRRIENVMEFEKLKARVNENPILKPFLAGPAWFLGQIKAPARQAPVDMPGRWPARSGSGSNRVE